MKLSSAFLTERLKKKYWIVSKNGISGLDSFLCPMVKENGNYEGHVMIAGASYADMRPNHCFQILLGAQCEAAPPYILLDGEYLRRDVWNDVRAIFDEAEMWLEKLQKNLLDEDGLDAMLKNTSLFLGNPLTIIGQDYSMVSEAGTRGIPARCELFEQDVMKQNFMNMLIQRRNFESASGIPVLYPAFIGGCRSVHVNLRVGDRYTHRLVMTEVQNFGEYVDFGILRELARFVEYVLVHTPEIREKSGLEDIFLSLLTDRTADYIQVSRRLMQLGWAAKQEYLCLVLQIHYQESSSMTVAGICRYIRKEYPDSCSFEFEGDVVAYFNITKLKLEAEEIERGLSCFIRDSYLKAGYSRVIQGHMNLRRQYIQAKQAIEVGSREKPYIWIYRFNQIVLPYIMEQSTRRLPGNMLCHEGVLELMRMDEENHTEYIQTLRSYLDTNLSATKAASELFIHRSTFLYRLDKIKEVLQSNLEDPDEIFYLNYSLRVME